MYKEQIKKLEKEQVEKLADKDYAEQKKIYAETSGPINELKEKQHALDLAANGRTLAQVKEFAENEQVKADALEEFIVLKNLASELVKQGKAGNDATGMTAAKLKLAELKAVEKRYGKDSSEFSAEAIKLLIKN